MKTKTLSKVGYAIGIFTIIIFTWKFFINADFTSMWLVGCGLGVIIMTFSYIYSWMKNLEDKVEGMNKIMIKKEWKE